MASIKEILEKEESSTGSIHLYLEGIFWKAYLQSAYRLVRRMGKLKVTKKYFKVVDREIVSVGFPDSALLKYFKEDEIIRVGEKNITIACDIPLEEYSGWFSTIPLAVVDVPTVPEGMQRISCQHPVLLKIKEFNMETATPLQCMNFLASIRQELHGNL
ncbi:hypothetical protein FACS189426_23340 [Bacteroidia bacterium]|nr:hypothetical protein FACS189426_23340 [Bacteroidia bacterium]GHT84681.1 hypothetical protein FACS18947_2480 [Bacteroidia bacterium]